MSENVSQGSSAGGGKIPGRLGVYRVEALIGAGGMGRVYRAFDEALNRPVAIKTLLPSLAIDPEFVARFKREAQSAAALNHPNITQIYAIGQEGAIPFFAMELIQGHSLEALVKDKGALDPHETAAYIRQAAAGLRHAAQKDLIHRDVKPSNLMLTEDGVVKLTDFGLAKTARSDTQITATGEVLGSPGYISPEQAQGAALDLRSDIYSLGATFYHLAIGKAPFEAPTAVAMILKHMNEPLRPPCIANPAIPYALGTVIQKMMAKRPQDRFQDYDALIRELERTTSASRAAGGSAAGRVIPAGAGRPEPASGHASGPRTRPLASRPVATGANDTARSGSWLLIALIVTLGIAAIAMANQQLRGGRESSTDGPGGSTPVRPATDTGRSMDAAGTFSDRPTSRSHAGQRVRNTIQERLTQRYPQRARADLVIVNTDHDILPNGILEVTGRVKNTGSLSAEQIRVRVRVLRDDGLVAARSETDLQPSTLAPGQETPFTALLSYAGPVGTISTELVWAQ